MINREIKVYANRNREQLVGIMHKADSDVQKDTVVVMLNPGLKSRVAPHRLYIKIADKLTTLGFSVFRFDAHSLGDSEGELEGNLKEILHDQVLSGAFVNDTIDTVNFLKDQYTFKKVILFGLCGGAMTALQTSGQLKNIEATVMLGLPVVFVGKKDQDFVKNLNTQYAEFILVLYLKKIFSLQAWKRFFSFKSEYNLILKTLLLKIKKKFSFENTKDVKKSTHPKINHIMWDKYPDLCKNTPRQLFVYAETEGNRFEFDAEVKEYFNQTAAKYYSKIDMIFIPQSNHEYSILKSQNKLLLEINNWFSLNFKN